MASTIKCTNCSKDIEITEAIRQELEDKILAENDQKHAEEIKKLKEDQDKFLEKQKEILKKEKEELEQRLRLETIEKVRKEYNTKIENTKIETAEMEKQNKELQEQLKTLLRDLRDTKTSKDKLEIEYQKKLLKEEDKIRNTARKEVEEEISLKVAEKNKKLQDAEKQIQVLQRKLTQGSQQIQGEVQEIHLEELLQQNFPIDKVQEVPKGIKGADIIQTVCTTSGSTCGVILWESKNTKNWSDQWILKLKEDTRSLKADIPIIVSKVLPDGIDGFGRIDNVWVTNIASAIPLTHALRGQLTKVHLVKNANKGKLEKSEIVYNYLISNEFKQRIEIWVEYFRDRRVELEKEKIYFLKKWEKEEKEIFKVMENTAGIYGDLQGLIGNALPKVAHLELPE